MSATLGRVTTSTAQAGFIADPNSIHRNTGRQIDWANVGEQYRTTPGGIVTVGAIAAQGATSVTVLALPVAIPSGTTLDFGGAKFARLTADAAAGATTLTVAALPTALAVNDVATVAGSGAKKLPAGTPVGELLGGGLVSPRVVTTNPATALLATDAGENDLSAALTGYGLIVGGTIFENLLPGGAPAGAVKTELAIAGCFFTWETYGANRS